MAVTREMRGRTPVNAVEDPSETKIEEEEQDETSSEGNADEVSRYEQLRQQRIKDNLERLQKLGVMDLTRKLKADYGPQKRPKRNPNENPSTLPSSDPPRRSSRLVNVARVTYQENKRPIKNKELKPVESEESEDSEGIEIYVEEGPVPEIYTEEHLKLLGDCKTAWTLFSEGYGEDGEREYDQFNLSCHQCRQRTRGHRTNCSCCRLGSFCGDCLYMGYGENVLEANQNKNWTCPKCRGICNCSRCRRDKGWKPIGDIYTKVSKLGFKSVGHYLIQTRQSEPKQVFLVDEDELSAAGSPATNPEIILSDDEKNTGKHSDDEYAEEDEAHNETDDGDDEDSDNDD